MYMYRSLYLSSVGDVASLSSAVTPSRGPSLRTVIPTCLALPLSPCNDNLCEWSRNLASIFVPLQSSSSYSSCFLADNESGERDDLMSIFRDEVKEIESERDER